MTYPVVRGDKTPHVFAVDVVRPEGAEGPETFGTLRWLPEEGMEVTMWCFEAEPRAIWHEPNTPVHTDSCMEAFLDFFPEEKAFGYLNLEVNANGAAKLSFGPDRYARRHVLDRGLPHPEVRAQRLELKGRPAWRFTCLLRRSLLEALYRRGCDLPAGHRMRGNFYKCGDHTDAPHWRSWSPVKKVDFHDPDTFGELIVE